MQAWFNPVHAMPQGDDPGKKYGRAVSIVGFACYQAAGENWDVAKTCARWAVLLAVSPAPVATPVQEL